MSRSIGKLLYGVRAGQQHLAWNKGAVNQVPACIGLTSPAFAHEETIPVRFAGKGVGENVSPELRWTAVPDGTQELVLVMEDPDVPLPRPFTHLIAYGIDPSSKGTAIGAFSGTNDLFEYGHNTFPGAGYLGPRALPAHGPHRYVFQLFAVNRRLSFDKRPTLKSLLRAMEGAVIGRGRLDGFFEQK